MASPCNFITRTSARAEAAPSGCRRALWHDRNPEAEESGGCVEKCVHRWLQKEESERGSQRNLSKPLVILGKLFISCSFSAGCAPSEHCGVLYLRKAYCCCNHTSNQTAVILCHSPTILQRLSAAGWEDIGWDCLKLNRFYLYPECRRTFLISF